MIEVEVREDAPGAGISAAPVLRRALSELGIRRASLGVLIVDPTQMAEINERHRGIAAPTDVLAFPLDGEGLGDWPDDGPAPELGDIVLCPDAASDPAGVLLIHGLLHLLGYDHEIDDGQMLARQAELLAREREHGASPSEVAG